MQDRPTAKNNVIGLRMPEKWGVILNNLSLRQHYVFSW